MGVHVSERSVCVRVCVCVCIRVPVGVSNHLVSNHSCTKSLPRWHFEAALCYEVRTLQWGEWTLRLLLGEEEDGDESRASVNVYTDMYIWPLTR